MLDKLESLPADPILGLSAACRADPNPDRVDLTVGIYMDEQGVCPVLEAVQLAQRQLVEAEITKAYLPAAGDEAFNTGMRRLVLGDDSPALADDRVTSIQTPGGCGALRIGAFWQPQRFHEIVECRGVGIDHGNQIGHGIVQRRNVFSHLVIDGFKLSDTIGQLANHGAQAHTHGCQGRRYRSAARRG